MQPEQAIKKNRLILGRLPARLSLLITIGLVCTHASATEYANLAGYKAQAIYRGAPQAPYTAHSQANKLAAAMAAQRACVTANPVQDVRVGYCELTHSGDAQLTPAADIKARVPGDNHPLFLWRYQKGDATVYLGGSVHILKTGLHPLPQQYQQAFDASEKLVLEVDLSAYTPQQMQFKTMQYAMLENGQQLTEVMSSETHALLTAATADYGLPLAQMAQFKPGFITQQLAVLALMSAGYDPAQGMESYFTQQAQNKEILELETLDFQLNLLLNQPLATQISMVEDTLAQLESFEPFTAELVRAWLAGDDAAFTEAFDAQSGASAEAQAFMHALMDERNVGMADKIAEFLNTQGTYFILAGAAHYIGENSVINLLKNKGFTGQRIYSNQTLNP